jgi:selenocysteine-specific elongation factor
VKHVVIGTAGHIDHGKSALVKALTGTDPDRLKEEKERGITIDLGFAFLERGEVSLSFVDVPGHERFVKNMLAGVGGIDVVLLIVAADESVMPQTREHFEICRLLRIPRAVVAITKVDLVELEMRELAALETRELMAGSALESAPLVFVSARTGEGLAELEQQLLRAAAEVEPRSPTGLFRLPVDRVFSMKGFGTVVTGTLISGAIGLDEEVEVLPRGLVSRVRGLQVHGSAVARAAAGQRTAVNLLGLEVSDLVRGDVLARPGSLAPSFMLDAELEALTASPVAIKDLTRLHLHLGTAQVVAQVRVLGGAKAIRPGERGPVQLRLEGPVVALPEDRFIVRRYSPLETVGGGVVLDAHPAKHRVASREAAERLSALRSGGLEQTAALFVEEAGVRGVRGEELARRLGVDSPRLSELSRSLEKGGSIHRVTERPLLLVSARAVEELSTRLQNELARFHQANPLREGISKGELREKLLSGAPGEVFDWLLGRLIQGGSLRDARDLVARADHRIQLSSEEAEAREFLAQAYLRAGYQPPTLAEVAQTARRDPKLLERVQRLLLQKGELVRVSEALVFHRQVLEELKQAIVRHKSKSDRIDVAFFKDLAGVTRKYAIPLLEWLDRERVTRRVGNERVIL